MPYTTVDLIKKQTLIPGAESAPAQSVEAVLTGTESAQLAPGRIVTGSVTVKSGTQAAPTAEAATFITDTITASGAPLVPGSLTLASDSSLGVIYSEGTDYTINYLTGSLTRAPSGLIPPGSSAHLWYFPYTLYVDGVDYSVDEANGRVTRIASGAILSSQRVTVDFKAEAPGFSDDVFNEAALEANQRVAALVDPAGNFGANLILQTAATYLGASIICRIAATAALVTDSQGKNASLWLETSRSFASDASGLLENFRPPGAALSGPKRA